MSWATIKGNHSNANLWFLLINSILYEYTGFYQVRCTAFPSGSPHGRAEQGRGSFVAVAERPNTQQLEPVSPNILLFNVRLNSNAEIQSNVGPQLITAGILE